MRSTTSTPCSLLQRVKQNLSARGVSSAATLCFVLWVGLVAVAWFASRTIDKPVSICLFLRVTGYPCATCGGTRAAASIATGNFLGAVALNPLATILIVGAPILLIWWTFVPPRAIAKRLPVRVQVVLLLVVVAANWAYVLWRFNRGEL